MSSQATILPIELVSFDAVNAGPFVSLNWVTASEVNSDYFTIERTTDERTFKTISQVKAAGQSMQTLTYQALDKNPSPGLSYYRLKQVDLDGTTTYSDMVAIEMRTFSEQITVSTSQISNGIITINLENRLAETLDISLVNIKGQILFATKNRMEEGPQSTIVIDNLGTLAKGLYILRISGAHESFNRKIMTY